MFKHWPSLPSSVGRTQKVFAARSRVGSRSLRQSPSGWPTGAMARGTRRPLQEVGNSWLVPPLTTAWRKPEAPAMPSCAPLVLLGCSSGAPLLFLLFWPVCSLLFPCSPRRRAGIITERQPPLDSTNLATIQMKSYLTSPPQNGVFSPRLSRLRGLQTILVAKPPPASL